MAIQINFDSEIIPKADYITVKIPAEHRNAINDIMTNCRIIYISAGVPDRKQEHTFNNSSNFSDTVNSDRIKIYLLDISNTVLGKLLQNKI